ncbi:hypothetical protein MS3_00005432 [Schistosoma haematobium]|uniref:G-protein coupled receptors family 1 profile domain-containing protein n=1 Tax=Schistosoma haematobium TaxID=6185 RepID=A0A922LKE0_SCHHA|nr:hypothetical protein MS3_00005432 [Schistosoma haematobium]KAH9587848.1 hypothetical protein MS3_00005432 [Schistosoma haematobium]CAH8554380.1 unnamed protein product [Schistosoma haematobium]CAH8558722.1 unnamed protein product [Schistosoma haematobium]
MFNSKGCLNHLTKEEIMVYTFRAYVSPILVIIGIPSNLLVILVFIIIEYQKTCRFNLYAIWMSIAHNIQLIVNTLIDDFLGRGLKYATQCKYSIQVDIESSFLCKTFTYLTDASALIAAFILMLFSVDRVCSIYNPKHFEQSSHVKLAHIIIGFVIIICLILNIPHLIFADLKIHPINNSHECQYINPVAGGVKYVLYLYIIGVAILPAIFIFITNILILYKLSTTVYRSKLIGTKDDESNNERGKVIAHLAISILFTSLSIPLVVIIILRQQVYFYKYDILYPEYTKQIVQYSKLFSSVDSFNHAFDFFLYLAFMPTFRRTLMDIFKCRIFLRNDHSNKKHHHDNHIDDKCEQQYLHHSEQEINIQFTDQETMSLYSNKLICVEDFYLNSNSLNYSTDPIPFIDQYVNYSPEHYTIKTL